MSEANRQFRLAIDIGGTFTDVVLDLNSGDETERFTTKVLTTNDDPANGVMEGLERVLALGQARPGDVTLVLHGTTLATNALIQRNGAKTALLTTHGHRDAVEMAFENRFEQYDINIDRPQPLVPRRLRLPVVERLDASGEVLIPLDEASLDRALKTLADESIESVVVGFLHAYANAEHEQRVARALRRVLPEVAVTLACEVCPEIREYERLSTACANAYVKPLMGRYLRSLRDQLVARGVRSPVLLMTSGGGLTTLETAAEFPIRLVESGPAGGAILAARVAAEGGYDRVLSFDMGGTTAKICLIDDATPLLSRAFEVDRVYRFKKGSGLPVRIPVIEMVEIGAGGGSIARVDKLNRITVGPNSAGSEPGPACYGRGGGDATVTDADVVLGRIDPTSFAGGQLALDAQAARQAIASNVGKPLETTAEMGAFGVGEVVDENMASAARAHSVEWGKHAEARTLVAYGGAAPLHAAQLAQKLKIDRIVVPADAGVGSAIGFLLAPVSYEVVRSRYMRLSAFDARAATAVMADMRAEALAVVRSATDIDELVEARRAYMRYQGQGYEIAVTLLSGEFTPEDGEVMRSAFDAEYQRLYGRTIPGLDIEVLSWTLTLSAPSPEVVVDPELPPTRAVSSDRQVSLFDTGLEQTVSAGSYLRKDLRPGDLVQGPAVVIEDQTTTVIPTGFVANVTSRGYLVLNRREPQS
ncbi:MAG: hydantoinase/oxoprolinase family protein [Pseudomonadales bacterium]